MALYGRTAIAVATLLLPLAGGPAQAASTTLGTAYYSSLWKAVVIPYRGPVPAYVLGTEDGPPRVFIDFNARYIVGTREGRVSGHPSLVGWAMAPRSASKTRITLRFKQLSSVKVTHHPRERLLVLTPQTGAPSAAAPRPAATAPPPPPGGASLGRVRYDAGRGAVVIPFKGQFPTYRSETLANPPRVFFDFEATGARDPQSGAIAGHASLVSFSKSYRDTKTMRVVLTLKSPTRIAVQHDPVRHEIVLVPQGSAPVPTPTPYQMPSAQPIEPTPPSPTYEGDPTLRPPGS